MMVFHSVPIVVQKLFPKRIWEVDTTEKKVFLTFDDGPVPTVTDFVLNELEKRSQKASFFMVGDNVRKHSALAHEVMSAGHQIGNHTYNHLNGFKTRDDLYFENFQKSEHEFEEKLGIQTHLFRPPYGLLRSGQAKRILETHQIVMWNVLGGDYVPNLSSAKIISEITRLTKEGAIILFHDQQKTKEVLPKFLPYFLDFLADQGYSTAILE